MNATQRSIGWLFVLVIGLACWPQVQAQQANATTLNPFGLVIRAFDNQIDLDGTDRITLMALQPIVQNTAFTLTNAIYFENSGNSYWSTLNGEPVAAQHIVYKGSNPIKEGDQICIELPGKDESGTSVITRFEINGQDASTLFEVQTAGFRPVPNIDLKQVGEQHLYIHQGIFHQRSDTVRLLGNVVDGVVIGVTQTALAQRGIPAELAGKELAIKETTGSGSGVFQLGDCETCVIKDEISLRINWIVKSGDERDEIEEEGICVDTCEMDCPVDDLVLEAHNCSISVKEPYPCSDVIYYAWSEEVDGDFVEISSESGTIQSIPNLVTSGFGLYQLEILCSDSCTYTAQLTGDCVQDTICHATLSVQVDDCVLSAAVGQCLEPMFQWQVDTGSGFSDILGATSSTYVADSEDPYRVVVSGCTNCDPLISESVTIADCSPPVCDCTLSVVEFNCQLWANQQMCDGYLGIWEYWDADIASWEVVGGNEISHQPQQNGTYRRNLSKPGCPVLADTTIVSCLPECGVTLDMEVTSDCKIRAYWTGCDSILAGFWYYAASTPTQGSCQNASQWTLFSAGPNDIINVNPDGSGEFIIEPPLSVGASCYRFELQCADCEVVTDEIWWEPCCSGQATILAVPETETVCDQEVCFPDQNPCDPGDAWYIAEITVQLPDGTTVLLRDDPTFNFNYCLSTCQPGAPSLTDLIQDLNNWLVSFGGTAQLSSSCPSGYTGIVISGSPVIFQFVDLICQDRSHTAISFQSVNCQPINTGNLILTASAACTGTLTYSWSNGESTATIIVPEDSGIYAVTATCSDGCTYGAAYDTTTGSSLVIQNDDGPLSSSPPNTIDQTIAMPSTVKPPVGPRSSVNQVRLYPNPTGDAFHAEVSVGFDQEGVLTLRDLQGKVVLERTIALTSGENQFVVDVRDIASGLYLVQLQGNESLGIQPLFILK